MKRNGKPGVKSVKIELPGNLTHIEDFIEVINEQSGLKLGTDIKFYSSGGNKLRDENLFLLKDNEIVYLEPYGNAFDVNNILEEFTVIEPLGKGGFGSVHKAQNKENGMLVAIKYIDITEYSISFNLILVFRASRVDEIYKETQALQKLTHPNIVKLYHTFPLKNSMVLIMEYVSGGELAAYVQTRIKDGYGLTEAETKEIFTQLVDAVSYCHNRFVIHRDLKPENLLLADLEKLTIKLIDFGIAGSNYGKSKDPTTAGSLYVSAPEALQAQRANAEPAIDIWAMGIILYFMLYGVFPFRGSTEKEVIGNILKKEVEFSEGRKRISKSCRNLILGLLKKNPKERMKMDDIYANEWFKLK